MWLSEIAYAVAQAIQGQIGSAAPVAGRTVILGGTGKTAEDVAAQAVLGCYTDPGQGVRGADPARAPRVFGRLRSTGCAPDCGTPPCRWFWSHPDHEPGAGGRRRTPWRGKTFHSRRQGGSSATDFRSPALQSGPTAPGSTNRHRDPGGGQLLEFSTLIHHESLHNVYYTKYNWACDEASDPRRGVRPPTRRQTRHEASGLRRGDF
jgi:hypothetical protein